MAYSFRDAHRPDLASGPYTITASWSVEIDGQKKAGGDETVDFFVAGERFALNPSDIQAVYPTEGSRGDYADSLPHVALARDTLPWERSAGAGDAPWLALVLLTASEAAAAPVKSIHLDDYINKLPARLRPFQLQPGQTGTDNVRSIELQADLLVDVLPSLQDLAKLCHVRAGDDGSVAVVASRRLPSPGLNTVHLVAIEDRYIGNAFDTGGQPHGTCTLISLKSWTFTCEPPDHPTTESLEGLFMRLDIGWLRLPAKDGMIWAWPSFGFVPLAHRFRSGEAGASWYAGPLVPRREWLDSVALAPLPASVADELLWYDEELGMLNVTYAAAWQLGRLLALQNPRILTRLHDWRRQVIRDAHAAAVAHSAQGHIPQVQSAVPSAHAEPPADLLDWLESLRKLQFIPHAYLLPDERILPAESIRFFSVDSHWLDTLIDGVLGAVRAPTRYAEQCRDAETRLLARLPAQVLSGLFLRSAAVAGWPGLEVTAADAQDNPLTLCPRARLSPSIACYLFVGRIGSVTLRQSVDTVHLSIEDHKTTPSLWQNASRRILNVAALNVPTGSAFAKALLHRRQMLHIPVHFG
jgi:hypothetical protein